MKKIILITMAILLGALIFNASATLDRIHNNAYKSFAETCDAGTVKVERTFSQFSVHGWNCDGPGSGGQGYTAQIWDHFFWIGS